MFLKIFTSCGSGPIKSMLRKSPRAQTKCNSLVPSFFILLMKYLCWCKCVYPNRRILCNLPIKAAELLKHREEDDMENCLYAIWKKRGDEIIWCIAAEMCKFHGTDNVLSTRNAEVCSSLYLFQHYPVLNIVQKIYIYRHQKISGWIDSI